MNTVRVNRQLLPFQVGALAGKDQGLLALVLLLEIVELHQTEELFVALFLLPDPLFILLIPHEMSFLKKMADILVKNQRLAETTNVFEFLLFLGFFQFLLVLDDLADDLDPSLDKLDHFHKDLLFFVAVELHVDCLLVVIEEYLFVVEVVPHKRIRHQSLPVT